MIIDIVCTFSATTIQAETKSVSLVLTFPATQLPSNICEEVQDCLGISPSGEADYFLNEQGDWVQVQGGGGGNQTLNEVLVEGNTTGGEDIFVSDGDAIFFDNGSRVRKGVTDAGNGGAKGVALVCSLDYELKWEAGRLYTMQQDGFTIREVSHNFTFTPTVNDDITKGFVIGSRWILDNGDVYVCSDETASAAVWALQVASVPTLQQVTDEGSITTNIITVGDTAGIYSEVADSYVGTANDANDTYAYIGNDGSLGLGNGTHESNLKNTNATTTGIILEFPNKAAGSYTIATTDEITNGTVTSVGLTMPSAFTVSNSPITSSGDIAVTGAGLVSQYVRGDGSLANFPASTGGGASQSFYLNGSVSQGTFGGVAFKEMDRVPILGAGTDFTINTNGYIQSFITDANVPNLLEIPAGNWNFETYFSASSGGGSPSFYVELYKWDGTTLSLIASNSATPEGITNGTVTDLYISALAVPQTALLATDRLAVRIYVNNSGRTIKLHTENNHLCQVITTFSTGITALNGLTDQVQNLAVGTSGTDFAINSATGTHTFNLPIASATNTGKLSSADWSTFDGKQNALGFTPENVANKQNSLAVDGTGAKYPTVDAINNLVSTLPTNLSVIGVPTTNITATGLTVETALLVIPLPVNSNNYLFRLSYLLRTVSTPALLIRIGTTASPINGNVGANSIGQQTQLATFTPVSTNINTYIRNFQIQGGSSGTLVGRSFTQNVSTDEVTPSGLSTLTVNTTVQQYLYISCGLISAGQSVTLYGGFTQQIKMN
jgi:hypothetical protein